jgi:hypothetical protein
MSANTLRHRKGLAARWLFFILNKMERELRFGSFEPFTDIRFHISSV